jgi:hypothetical protein
MTTTLSSRPETPPGVPAVQLFDPIEHFVALHHDLPALRREPGVCATERLRLLLIVLLALTVPLWLHAYLGARAWAGKIMGKQLADGFAKTVQVPSAHQANKKAPCPGRGGRVPRRVSRPAETAATPLRHTLPQGRFTTLPGQTCQPVVRSLAPSRHRNGPAWKGGRTERRFLALRRYSQSNGVGVRRPWSEEA